MMRKASDAIPLQVVHVQYPLPAAGKLILEFNDTIRFPFHKGCLSRDELRCIWGAIDASEGRPVLVKNPS